MKGLEMVKCESLRINMLRITHTGKSVNFPVAECKALQGAIKERNAKKELKKKKLAYTSVHEL